MALIMKVSAFSVTTFSDDKTDTVKVHERMFLHPRDAVEYVIEPFLTEFYYDSHPDDKDGASLRPWLNDTMVLEPARLSPFEDARVEALGFTWIITKHTMYLRQNHIEVEVDFGDE